MFNKTFEIINNSGSYNLIFNECKYEFRNIVIPSYEVMFIFSLLNLIMTKFIFIKFVPEKYEFMSSILNGIYLSFLFFAVLKLTGVIL